MNQPKYEPGQAYKIGYAARQDGKEMPDTFNIGIYWDEYRAGWFDANRSILENVRKDYEDSRKKLEEHSETRKFLQD